MKWCIFFLFSASVLVMPQAKLAALHQTYYDLGLIGHSLIHADSILGAFDGHAYFFFPFIHFIVTLSPNYVLEIMLLIQSIGIIVGAFLLLRTFSARLFYLYVLAYPVWGVLLFDFHYEFLLFPLMAIFFSANYSGKKVLLFASAILIGMVKEPYWLTVSFLGLYCLVFAFFEIKCNERRNSWMCAGIGLFAMGLVMFWVCRTFLIYRPYDSINADAFGWIYTVFLAPEYGVVQRISSVFSTVFLDWQKLLSVAAVFFISPIIFGCDRKILIVLIPTALLMLLSQNSLHYKYNAHYYAPMVIPLVLAVREFNLRFHHFLIPFFLHAGLSGSPASFPFWSGISWSSSFSAYQIQNSSKELASYLLDNNNLDGVMVQNNVINSQLVNAQQLSVFPTMLNFHDQSLLPKTIILAKDRPLFLDDQSCRWRFGQCTDMAFVKRYEAIVETLSPHYSQKNIAQFVVFSRKRDDSASHPFN